tara:strand:+ start:166 stop:2025 length:1860 start_codon:yes stop_codon:yes gene_type:complete
MKKIIPLSLSIIVLTIVCFTWDYIKLPYNNENKIIGEHYFKKFNPLNDTIRFLSFTFLPTIVYLTSYLFINKETYNLDLSSKYYFLNKRENNYHNPLNLYFFLFIVIISLEFFSVNYSNFIGRADVFHAGTFLVPPINYLNNKEFFNSTLYDYGFIANNFGLISKFFLGYYTIGSINFIKLLLIYLVKLFLILISKKIATDLILNDVFKKIFFIILVFFAISLPTYYDFNSFFSYRHALYLIFVFILGSTLCANTNLNIRYFIIGTFSLISILWWIDIGAYVNALIVFSIIYLLIHKNYKNSFLLTVGVLVSWTLFFIILPNDETKEFIFQIKLIYSSVWEYMIGTEYPKPFSTGSSRWTKALLLIYISSIMLINLNFSQKFYVSYKTKIFTILLFISGIFVFKTALLRSDSFHIKYSSGLYTLVFVIVLLLFLFQRIEAYKKIKYLIANISKKNLSKSIFLFYIGLTFLFLSGIFNKNENTEVIQKIKNIKNIKTNIKYLIEAKDDLYLNENSKSVLKYYKEISKQDNCIQILSDDIAFSYFLRKPTCTQFYIPAQIITGHTEKKFINQLKFAAPKIILYKSPNNILSNPNMPNALAYINKEYSFFKNYNNYIFYKKN